MRFGILSHAAAPLRKPRGGFTLTFVLQIDREREGKRGKGKRMFSNGCSVIAGFLFIYNKKAVHFWTTFCKFWQGHKDLNPEPTVLETAALPIELYPYFYLSSKAKP